jgi:hypothetical protein
MISVLLFTRDPPALLICVYRTDIVLALISTVPETSIAPAYTWIKLSATVFSVFVVISSATHTFVLIVARGALNVPFVERLEMDHCTRVVIGVPLYTIVIGVLGPSSLMVTVFVVNVVVSCTECPKSILPAKELPWREDTTRDPSAFIICAPPRVRYWRVLILSKFCRVRFDVWNDPVTASALLLIEEGTVIGAPRNKRPRPPS